MRKIVNFLITIALLLITFVIQTSVFPFFKVAGITPNLMIVATCSLAFMLGDIPGLFLGLFAGLLCDLMFGPLMGFYGAVYALIGFISGKFRRLLYVEDLSFPLVLVAVCDYIYGFLSYVFLFLIRNRLYYREFLLQFQIPEILYTVVVGIVFYPLFALVYKHFMKEKRKVPLQAASISGQAQKRS